VTLVTSKDRFKVHILVLCALLTYFKEMLTSEKAGRIITGCWPVPISIYLPQEGDHITVTKMAIGLFI